MIILEKTDIHSTLTTWLYCHFWMMWGIEQRAGESYINWPIGKSPKSYEDKEKFKDAPNMYDWYFKQPFGEFTYSEGVCVWENWHDQSPVPFMAQPLKIIKDYYKKHLHFSEEVEVRGAALVAKYNIDFNSTIGVTWRGTDCVTDGRPYLPIETYFPFIDDILKDNPNLSIMATAEEYGILEPLFDRYPNSFTITEFISSPKGSKNNPERFSQVSGFERGMQPALMVWLFSKCAYYIKNRSSTGAVASWLSDGKIISLGHPENLGFPANTDTAEIEGKLYPLHR